MESVGQIGAGLGALNTWNSFATCFLGPSWHYLSISLKVQSVIVEGQVDRLYCSIAGELPTMSHSYVCRLGNCGRRDSFGAGGPHE